jgi:hypothetical protein
VVHVEESDQALSGAVNLRRPLQRKLASCYEVLVLSSTYVPRPE